MKTELNNRVALVLDGTGPLGIAICRQLAQSGARVVATVANGESGAWQAQRAEEGLNITLMQTDIRDFDACVRLVDEVESSVGPIDIIVNSHEPAGQSVPFESLDRLAWERQMAGGLDPLFNVCRNLAERMGNRGFGRIIHISSIIGRMGLSGQAHVSTVAAGIHGFSMALAQEVARKGVTVNTVSPGHITLEGDDDSALAATVPAGRLCSSEDVANLVDFLCSDQAGFINGADIPVNGAQYLH